jgi:hypothetical protein
MGCPSVEKPSFPNKYDMGRARAHSAQLTTDARFTLDLINHHCGYP